jgi:hypothetical protein
MSGSSGKGAPTVSSGQGPTPGVPALPGPNAGG